MEEGKTLVLLCKCLKTVTCICIVQSLRKFMVCIQMLIKTSLVCEVSLLNRTKRKNKDICERASDSSEIIH